MSNQAVEEKSVEESGDSPLRVAFHPDKYSRRAFALILEKCQQWNCSPADAQARLLDELAAKRKKAS